MARHGIDYSSVKQAALKLLSQGTSPSVQKIRELLGTGSNTTIAEHLKVWREEHAQKKVHHLPASLPEELIGTFETLWQTALSHAEEQLTHATEELEAREKNLAQDKKLTEKTIADLQVQKEKTQQALEVKNQENQTLQTQLAVTTERSDQQSIELEKVQKQHDLQLKHLQDEKQQMILKADALEKESEKLQQQLTQQAEKYEATLAKESDRQEESEKRWAKLISQARTEAEQLRKQHDKTTQQQHVKLATVQNQLTQQQEQLLLAKTKLAHKEELEKSLNKQIRTLQAQHIAVSSELAVVRSKLEAKKSSKKPAKTD